MSDIYRISVAISLTNNVSAALKIIQRDVLGLGRAIDLTQGKFDRMKLAVFGAAGVAIGAGAAAAFYGLAKAGGQVLDAQAKMLQVGISVRDVTQETAIAMKSVGVAGATLAGNISDLLKLRGILGDFQGANMALPGYEQSKFVLAGAGISPDQIDSFIKPLDIMGAFLTKGQIDASKFGPALQMATSAILTTNGLLTGAMFQRAVQLSGPVAAQMGEQKFLQTMLEPLLALGTKAARGLMYGGTTLIGGMMSKASARRLDELGLTTPADYSHEGGRWSLEPNRIAGYKLLNTGDVPDWVIKYFLPAAARAHMSPLVAAASLPQTLQALVTAISMLGPQTARSVMQLAQAGKADPYGGAMTSMTGAVSNFETSFQGLMQVLGTPAATLGVTVLNDLAGGIRGLTQWAGTHPAVANATIKVLLGVGAALGVLGSAAIVASLGAMVGVSGTIGLVAVGLGAIGGALLTVQHPLKDAKAVFKAVGGWVVDLTRDVTGLAHPFQVLSNDFKVAAGWVDGLAASLTGLVHPIQVLQNFLGLSASTSTADIHGVVGRRVPASAPINSPAAAVSPPVSTIHGTSGRHVPQQLGEVFTVGNEHLAMLSDWVSRGAPVTVNGVADVKVQNTGDIARGANAFVGRQLGRPNTGATGVNLRATPAGSAALAIPAYG